MDKILETNGEGYVNPQGKVGVSLIKYHYGITSKTIARDIKHVANFKRGSVYWRKEQSKKEETIEDILKS